MALHKSYLLLILHLVAAFSICYADDYMLRLTRGPASAQTTSYNAQLKVGTKKVETTFSLSTLSTEVSVASCTAGGTAKASLTIIHRTGFFNNENDFTVKGIKARCTTFNELALGPSNVSFPVQFARAANVSRKFSYCLPGPQGTGGEIYFGHEGAYRFYHHTDILNSSLVPVSYIPGLEASFFGGYQVVLSSMHVGKKTFRVNTPMLIGLVVRYTSVPDELYNALRAQFVREAGSMKLKKDSSTFEGLDVCYSMTSSQLSKFSTLTMNFTNTSWKVPPQNYVQPSNKKGVSCFGIRNSSQNARGVSAIGTLQQEDNVVEYDLERKKLGVTGSLVANLDLTCGSTRGT